MMDVGHLLLHYSDGSIYTRGGGGEGGVLYVNNFLIVMKVFLLSKHAEPGCKGECYFSML